MARTRRAIQTLLTVVVLAVASLAPRLVASAPERPGSIDPSLFRELRWRPIGPLRGGRTKTATGVRGRPGLFYMGVVDGGVWKTTDYGRSWLHRFVWDLRHEPPVAPSFGYPLTLQHELETAKGVAP